MGQQGPRRVTPRRTSGNAPGPNSPVEFAKLLRCGLRWRIARLAPASKPGACGLRGRPEGVNLKRLCPKCGKKTQEARCPDDGTATLVLSQNPDSKLPEGTEVNGRYRIDKIIGQGGFGAVYKAKNMATDQDIAIKLLAVALDQDDSDVIQRFFAEAQVTASLKHPNTIKVFDFGQTEGGALYIAMELLSGRPLNEELRDRMAEDQPFTELESITIGSQVLRSLSEAHVANLVHRDLKPHNIFLHQVHGDDPVVKVLDFGIAKRLGSNLTGTGKAFGTPAYMSPEQAQNKNVDQRSDIYSLGCVLYQLATGKTPFDADNPLSILMMHVTENPPDLRGAARSPVSENFVRVIEKAMAKQPSERFDTAIEMRQALDACRGADRIDPIRQTMLPSGKAVSDDTEAETESYDVVLGRSKTSAYADAGKPRTPPALRPATGPRGVTPIAGVPFDSATAGIRATADDLSLPSSQKSLPLAMLAAGGAVLALVAAIGGYFATRNDEKPVAPPVALVAAPAQAAAAAPVAAPAPSLPVAEKAPAGPVEVVLNSKPGNAAVKVGEKELGKTPYTLKIQGAERVTVLLQAEGYADREMDVSRNDAPSLQVELRKVDVVEDRSGEVKKLGVAPVKPKTGGKASGDKANNKSALEERL